MSDNIIELKPRLPFTEAARSLGISESKWRILANVTFPKARTVEGILLAVAYCEELNVDPGSNAVAVVQMWDSDLGREVEQVFPTINELQIRAARTNEFAGKDAPVFGPPVTRTFKGQVPDMKNSGQMKALEVTVTFPEWCEVTVHRIVGGLKCPYTERVHWLETCPTIYGTEVPIGRWVKRPNDQLAKCAKAASLRLAFPKEVIGYAAEEMEGKVLSADEVGGRRPVSKRVGPASPHSAESAEDAQADTGDVVIAPDLTLVDASLRQRVGKMVGRGAALGAWEATASYLAEQFQGNDLAYARLVLKHAETYQSVSDRVRNDVAELIRRAGANSAWEPAKGFLTSLHARGQLSDLDHAYALAEVDLARAFEQNETRLKASA